MLETRAGWRVNASPGPDQETDVSDPKTAAILKRFWPKVARGGPDDCWLWTAGVNHAGYGSMGGGRGVTLLAHRVSWEVHRGPIPQGLFVCHHCDNPPCVNPRHLFIGSQRDNMDDKVRKGRQRRGQCHCLAKLTEVDVQSIRRRYAASSITQQALADEFGITQSNVSMIVNGVTWSNLT